MFKLHDRSKAKRVRQMERNDSLIKQKIYKYMLTGVMTTIALQLGNVVDAMIVGNLLGSIGNAAVSASMPYTYLLQAATILLASGGAVISAVLLGKHDSANAGKVMGGCLAAGLAYPLIFAAASPALVPAYVRFTGAGGDLAEMIGDFSFVYSVGMPVISLVIMFSYFMNADSHPSWAAGMNITANAVNLVLDFVLVKFTPLGMKGAALSTALGYLAAGLIFIPLYMRSGTRMLRPDIKGLTKMKPLAVQTLKRGLPNLAYLVMTVIAMSIMNRVIIGALGDGYYSAYAVTDNTQNIVQMFLNGISSVIASVAGVLYGEKDYFGMRTVLKRVLKAALTAGAVIMAVFLAVPGAIALLYGYDNAAVMPELLKGLRIFSFSFGFFILNAVSQNYYRTTGQTFLATAGMALELLIFKVPLMIAGMKLFGFSGLFAAIIASELLAFILLNAIRIYMQKTGKVPQKGFMAIPDRRDGEICDLTIKGGDENAVDISGKIIEYCINEDMSERQAKIMGLATEELVANIGRHGYPDTEKKNIDICLSKSDGSFFLRLRDDGVPFDPVSYEPADEQRGEKYIGGLELLKKLAVNISYMRVINLNNTIVEIKTTEGADLNE